MSAPRQEKCPDCGRWVDVRRHNMKKHRATHHRGGSRPLNVTDLFEQSPQPQLARKSNG